MNLISSKRWRRTTVWGLAIVMTTVLSCRTVPSDRQAITTKLSSPPRAEMSLSEVFAGLTPATRPATLPAKAETRIVSEAVLAYFQAKEAVFQEDDQAAIDQLNKAIALDENYLPAHQLLMTLAFEKDQPELAEREARKVLQLEPEDPMANYVLGSLLLEARDSVGAMRYLYQAGVIWEREGGKPRLESLLAAFKLGGLLAGEGYLSATIEVYQPLLAKMEQLDGDAADPRIERMIRIYQPGLQLLLGEFSYKLKRYTEALRYYETGAETPAIRRQASIGMIRCHLAMGETTAAKTLLDELGKEELSEPLIEFYRKFYPNEWADKVVETYLPTKNNLPAGLGVSNALIKEGKFESAVDLLKKILVVDPENKQAIWLTVRAYSLNGQADRAARILMDSVTKLPQAGVIFPHDLEQIDAELGRSLERAISELTVEDRDEYAKCYLLGLTSQAGQRYEQAEEYFRNTLKLKKDFSPAYLARGQLLLQQRRWSAAVEAMDRATAEGVKTGGVFYIRGKALGELNETKASLEALEAAKTLSPDSDRILLALTEGYLRNGESAKAAELLKRLIGQQLAGKKTLVRLIEFLLDANNPTMAEGVLQQYRQRFGEDATWRLLDARNAYQEDRDVAIYRSVLSALSKETVSPELLAKAQADLEFSMQNFQQAAEITRHTLDRSTLMDPVDYRRLMQLDALSNWKLLNYDRAEWGWRQLLNDWPGERMTSLALTQMLMDAREYGKAQTLVSKLLESETKPEQKSQLRVWLIACQMGQDRLLDALNTLDRWLVNVATEEQPGYLQLKIDCLLRKELYPETLALLDQLIGSQQPPLKKWQQTYVSVLTKLNQPERAFQAVERFEAGGKDEDRRFYDELKIPLLLKMKDFDQAIALARKASETTDVRSRFVSVLTLIECYREAGDYEAALALARDEETKMPAQSFMAVSLRQQIARTMEKAGNREQAERYILDQIARAEGDLKNRWQQWLIALYYNLNETDKAIALLEEILATNPNLAWANNSLGYSLADRGRDLDRSERLVRKALADEPGSVSYLDSLAWVLYRRGSYDQAYRYAIMASRGMTEPDPVILDHLGDICLKLNKIEEAKEYWRHSIKLCEERDPATLEPGMPERTVAKLKKLASKDRR